MWTKSLSALCIAMSVSMTQGCAAWNQPSAGRSSLDASLTEPCPPLEPLKEKDGKAALQWMMAAATAYADCSGKHRKIADAVR